MAYVTTEERVDRLEAVFGQFMTEMAVLNRASEQRNRAAEERDRAAEERNRAAEERNQRADQRDKVAKERFAQFQSEMAAINRAAEERNRAAEERMARFEQEMREFKAEMRASKRELDKKWGDLANKMGTIIEDILAPNLRRLADEHFRFPTIEDFMIRRSRRHGGQETEFDTLVVGPAAVILGEAKSSPSIGHAEEFAAKVRVFFDYFPEYRGRRLIPILGSWSIPDPVIERLTALGIYAMRMGEDTMELANAAALEGRPPEMQ